jgi:hypothetical protein
MSESLSWEFSGCKIELKLKLFFSFLFLMKICLLFRLGRDLEMALEENLIDLAVG